MTVRQYAELHRQADVKYRDTAYRLLGIDDDWTTNDIHEHLEWLIDNPSEIVDGYDKSVFQKHNIDSIMWHVKQIKDSK